MKKSEAAIIATISVLAALFVGWGVTHRPEIDVGVTVNIPVAETTFRPAVLPADETGFRPVLGETEL